MKQSPALTQGQYTEREKIAVVNDHPRNEPSLCTINTSLQLHDHTHEEDINSYIHYTESLSFKTSLRKHVTVFARSLYLKRMQLQLMP